MTNKKFKKTTEARKYGDTEKMKMGLEKNGEKR